VSTVRQNAKGRWLVLCVSSVQLVAFLQEIGLVQGNKVQLQCGIPNWIFEKPEYMQACVRGMMDTDGCVYHHAYKVNGKEYRYVKMTYAGRSWPLLEGLQEMLRRLGFKPGAVRKPGYLSISSDKEVRRYYEEAVGTHNPYHWRRYQEAIEQTRRL
jgi:intein/homing endonuclease